MQALSKMTNLLNLINISRTLYFAEMMGFETGFIWVKEHMVKHPSRIRVSSQM